MQERWTRPETAPMLWAGVTMPPLAWALNLQLNYMLTVFACSPPWSLSFHVISAACLAIALGAGRLSWRAWDEIARVRSRIPDDDRLDRREFMAISGVLLSLIFSLTIVAQWFPTFLLPPCHY